MGDSAWPSSSQSRLLFDDSGKLIGRDFAAEPTAAGWGTASRLAPRSPRRHPSWGAERMPSIGEQSGGCGENSVDFTAGSFSLHHPYALSGVQSPYASSSTSSSPKDSLGTVDMSAGSFNLRHAFALSGEHSPTPFSPSCGTFLRSPAQDSGQLSWRTAIMNIWREVREI